MDKARQDEVNVNCVESSSAKAMKIMDQINVLWVQVEIVT